jgi:hypothetical protein
MLWEVPLISRPCKINYVCEDPPISQKIASKFNSDCQEICVLSSPPRNVNAAGPRYFAAEAIPPTSVGIATPTEVATHGDGLRG